MVGSIFYSQKQNFIGFVSSMCLSSFINSFEKVKIIKTKYIIFQHDTYQNPYWL